MTHAAFAGGPWADRRNWMFSEAEEDVPRRRHRHGRNRPFGPDFAPPFRGPGFGGPGFGGPRFGRPRKRRGDVRLAILRLLAEEPRNGYQIMQAIEERSAGSWRPSPGSVYPSLSQLEDEGLIRATERDGTKVFELTDPGREHAGTLEEEPDPWDLGPEASKDARHELWWLFKQVALAVKQVADAGDEQQLQRARDTLTETRRALYRILADESDE
jgi:DNA-binding PadR family transcriptional regulator